MGSRFDWNWFPALVSLRTPELDKRTHRRRKAMTACTAVGGAGPGPWAVVSVRAGGVVGRRVGRNPIGNDRSRGGAIGRRGAADGSEDLCEGGSAACDWDRVGFQWRVVQRQTFGGGMDVRTTVQVEPGTLSGLLALHFDQESTDALAEISLRDEWADQPNGTDWAERAHAKTRRLVGRGACREGLPTLPGRGFIFVLDRWLTPPANLRQASGLG